jgi:hypothetical protein
MPPELDLPLLKSILALKEMEKKRLSLGSRMASEIDASITDSSVIVRAKGTLYFKRDLSGNLRLTIFIII